MGKFVAAGVVAGVGVVLVAVGCILIPVFDDFVYDTVVDAAKYEEGTDGYDNLVNPSSPTYTYFYFFNLTNPDEVMNNGVPIVKETGPYVYETTKPKQNITFYEDGTQIGYRTLPTYILDRERTVGDPYTDVLTAVNFVVLTAAKLLDEESDFITRDFVAAVDDNNDTVFETYTVNDYLWGYFDETLDESGLVPLIIPSAWQGLFYGVNETLGEEWVVFSGTDDIDLVNEVHTWKGFEYPSYIPATPGSDPEPVWASDSANTLNGTDGTQYKPFLEKDDLLYTFSSDLCRSFKMLYDSEVDVRGINTYRFVIDPANFANTTENLGFCLPSANFSDCLPEGLLNVERCFDEAPMVASLPHYYEVDPAIQATISGMNPVKELHETAIDVEPTTGISLQGNKRLQINIRIKHWRLFPDTLVDKFAGDGFILPIFWINEQTEISEPDAEDYKSEVIEPIELLEIVQYVVIGVGAFVVLVGLVLFAYFGCTRNRKRDWSV